MAGAPISPRASTSQPARPRTAWRAAASPTMFEVVAPVVNPQPASAGRPRISRTHRPAISSITEAAGLETYENAF